MDPFVIFTMPRTGCSRLLDVVNDAHVALHGHPISKYEFFGRHKVQTTPYRMPYADGDGVSWMIQNTPWDDTQENWINEIDRRISLLANSRIRYVFKVFADDLQYTDRLFEFINTYDVVLLRRRNILEQFLSTVKAHRTGVWNGPAEPILDITPVHRWEFDWFAEKKAAYERSCELFRSTRTLFYEDFEDNEAFIFDFFGLPKVDVPPRTVKNAQRTQWVANIAEVKVWMTELNITGLSAP